MLSQLSPQHLAKLCNGEWYQGTIPSARFTAAQIDSRLMDNNQLFVALHGEQTDGHKFIVKLDPERHQAAIVEQPAPQALAAQLCVANSLDALQTLSKEIASRTTAVKFAITGSVGKTGTKDMLYQMLTAFGPTHATKGNYNNHIGTPLTLAQMPDDTQFLVCELGMNHAGEIADLSAIVKPAIAAITSIADSHIGNFDSLQQIADAKAELFSGLTVGGTAILPRDDAFFTHLEAAAKTAGAGRILSFGIHPESTFRLVEAQRVKDGLLLTIDCPCEEGEPRNRGTRGITFELAMKARHWAVNAACALAMCAAAGLNARTAAAYLSDFADLPGRGKTFDLTIGGHTVRLIDDSYNAGPASMKAALNTLAELPGKHGVIMSDMLELGDFATQAHQTLAKQLKEAGISWVIAIGPQMTAMTVGLPDSINCICHPNINAALSALDQDFALLAEHTDYLLVKGSHGSGGHLISQHMTETYSVGSATTEVHHAS